MYMIGMCYLMTDFVDEPCKLLPLLNKGIACIITTFEKF